MLCTLQAVIEWVGCTEFCQLTSDAGGTWCCDVKVITKYLSLNRRCDGATASASGARFAAWQSAAETILKLDEFDLEAEHGLMVECRLTCVWHDCNKSGQRSWWM